MALNIKNPEVGRLAAEVAALTGESKTEAVRQALSERHQRLRVRVSDSARAERIQRFLSREVWSRRLCPLTPTRTVLSPAGKAAEAEAPSRA